MKDQALLVVADAARARLFLGIPRTARWQESADLVDPAARLSESERTASPPGRSFDREGPGRHAMAERTPKKNQGADAFARRVAEQMLLDYRKGLYGAIVLAVAPGFLGHLRGHLDTELLQLVTSTIDKDWTRLPLADIGARVRSVVRGE